MIDWQPISTAPKDESEVLLFFPSGGGMISDDGYVVAFWSTDDETPGWYQYESDSRRLTEWGDEPTHWAKLTRPTT